MAIDFPDTTGTNPATGSTWATGDTYTDAGTSYQYSLNSTSPVMWVGAGIGGSDASYLRLDATNAPLTGVLTTNSGIRPVTDNSTDLGTTTLRWANIYTGDLHLKNDRGDWTMIEEDDALTMRNNKTGKVYNIMMQERA